MTHKALATKYRPQTFEEIVGQGAVVKTLQNALRTGRIHPAYIFSGIRGVGKTTIARIVAKGLNCTGSDGAAKGPTPFPCGTCDSCAEIAACRSLDVLEIDGASNNKVEEARDLTQLARYTPARDRYRVFIIDEVHMLSQAAFNALLKTLEEPPAHVIFLLATTEPRKIPETIHSRAQHFEFRKVASSRIAAHLESICKEEGLEAEPAALDLVARAGDGSVRDSLTLLDRLSAYTDGSVSEADAAEVLGLVGREVLFRAADAMAASDAKALLVLLGEVLDRGRETRRFLEDLADHTRRLLRERLADAAPPGGEPEETSARFRIQAARFSPEDLLRLQDLLLSTLQRLKDAPAPEALLELQFLKAAHLPRILPLDALLRGASPPSPGPAQAMPGTAPARTLPPGAPPPTPDETAGSQEAGLRFTSLTAFHRMGGEEARSFEGDEERFALVRARLAKAFPLAQGALEKASLSADPDGVLHVALSPAASAGLVLLGTPERKRVLDDVAREEGFPGGISLEKKEEEGESEVPAAASGAHEPGGTFSSKAVDSVKRILGAQLLEVRKTQETTGEGHDEPE